MNLIEIPEISFRAEVPSHWDEMKPTQVAFCAKQAILASFGLISPIEAKVRCLYHLLDIQRDWKTEVWEKNQHQALVLEKRSKAIILSEQLCSFIFKESEDRRPKTEEQESSVSGLPSSVLEVNYNTVTNHFPQLQAGKTLLHGPGSLLTGLKFGEFRHALTFMQDYFDSKAKDQRALSKMLACLYRQGPENLPELMKQNDWNGQTRVRFNFERIEEYADHCDRLSAVQRTTILLWFTFCIDFIKKEEIPINGVPTRFGILFEGSGSSGQGTGWTGVVYSVAEKRIFGDADGVDERDFFEVLFYLYDKKLENKRIEAKLKSKKR